MQAESLVIEAKSVFTPFQEITDAVVEVKGKQISWVGAASEYQKKPRGRIEAHKVAPGFIDMQVNGAGGIDAAAEEEDGLNRISCILARFGVTAFLPTVITAPESDLIRSLRSVSRSLEKPVEGAAPLGIHLEGPFINPTKRGAHPLNAIKIPKLTLFRKFEEAANGRIVYLTLAPELPGSLKLANSAQDRLPIISMGHSDATYDQALEGLRNGFNYATHTFNAMHDFHHREPGLVGLILKESSLRASIIADGTHVHPSMVEIFLRAKGPTRAVLTTDSISAAGMPDGEHRLGTLTVFVKDGICRNPEGRLAGSSLTMDAAVRNCVEWTGMPWTEILPMAAYNSAAALGIGSRKGKIAKGADADLVLLDEKWEVERTIVAGRIVYERS
ncbi:MAG TPA: N-acetylglucosamine-6-phosphate deacetylase [Acidobacteriota bacterium]|nr:N-acetylglucosamine-6-phosphate deacetylase [Acidobacteriota bacterium]